MNHSYIEFTVLKSKISPSIAPGHLYINVQIFYSFDPNTIDENGKKGKFKIVTKNSRLKSGSILKFPMDQSNNPITSISVDLYGEEKNLTVEVGCGVISKENLQNLDKESTQTVTVNIFDKAKSDLKLGKIQFMMFVKYLFSSTVPSKEDLLGSESTSRNHNNIYDREVGARSQKISRLVPNNFRFRPINKRVNWDKIRTINIERLVNKNDQVAIESCVDDVLTGDISNEGSFRPHSLLLVN
jgi:hypothetical protein